MSIGSRPARVFQLVQRFSRFRREGILTNDEAIRCGQGKFGWTGVRIAQSVASKMPVTSQKICLPCMSLARSIY